LRWVSIKNYTGGSPCAPPYTGTPIAATTVRLNQPYGIALDNQKRLYIADSGDSQVVVLDPPYTQARRGG
jgi:DNA-binding beta-propeller fold protein YncE